MGLDVRLLAVRRESCGGNGVVVGIKSETASEDSPLPKRAFGAPPSPPRCALSSLQISNQCCRVDSREDRPLRTSGADHSPPPSRSRSRPLPRPLLHLQQHVDYCRARLFQLCPFSLCHHLGVHRCVPCFPQSHKQRSIM